MISSIKHHEIKNKIIITGSQVNTDITASVSIKIHLNELPENAKL